MKANDIIANLPEELAPLRQLAEKLLAEGSTEVPEGVAIARRLAVAPEYNALFLFTGITREEISQYETRFSLTIPAIYKTLLTQVNGLHAFELSLFGIPASMMLEPPLLDRVHVGPSDIGIANQDWKRSYRVDPLLFHFGKGPLSLNENLGYFLSPTSHRIHACRKNGELFNSWVSMRDFLTDELKRAETEFPSYEVFMRSVQQSAPQEANSWFLQRIFAKWR
jgi:hypothetical protein